MSDQGVYLYAICRQRDTAGLAGSPGVGASHVRVLDVGELGAVVSSVPLTEFGEVGLRRNLEDLQWVEAVARAHNAVVAECFRRGPVAPVSLATVCFDDAAVVDRVSTWQPQVLEALARVDGCSELGVKVYQRQDESAGAPSPVPAAAPGAGAAYLQKLKADAQRREFRSQALTATVEQVHHRLSGGAVASRRHPVQDPRLSGHAGQMVLNGAYLVDADDTEQFRGQVADISSDHPDLELELTGPWPPYSFVTLEAS
ncbi:MAG: GvpL/GvpF family gas vesicle protein [Oryzihumus sp.]